MQISLPGTALRFLGSPVVVGDHFGCVFAAHLDLDRLPPGLFFDETFNAVDAEQVLAGDSIFLTGNNGREPLFIYLQAAALSGLGLQCLCPASGCGSGAAFSPSPSPLSWPGAC
jgi:hypothetical protein